MFRSSLGFQLPMVAAPKRAEQQEAVAVSA
jgi:hypothetical protein